VVKVSDAGRRQSIAGRRQSIVGMWAGVPKPDLGSGGADLQQPTGTVRKEAFLRRLSTTDISFPEYLPT
jgi:hypothetical protein